MPFSQGLKVLNGVASKDFIKNISKYLEDLHSVGHINGLVFIFGLLIRIAGGKVDIDARVISIAKPHQSPNS